MTPRRPEVFISATSADLRSCRQLVKEALLTLGCVPVEQTNFPPDYRSVRDMLRARIVACDAVVHIAGNYYGAEPRERAAGEPRRSYTQMEYDVARELGKPLYVFVCGDDFAYDPHQPEEDDKRALQQAHRAALRATDHLFYQVGDRGELSLKVRELQTAVEHLTGELKKSRSHLARGVAIGLVAIGLLGGGVWWLSQRADKTEATVAKLETEIEKQRRYIQAVADAYTQQQAELEQLKLSDEEQFNRALAAVAAKESLAEAQLRSGINLFVAAVRADPQANFMDRALAEFAQKNFTAAAANAGQAGAAAREQRRAANELAAKAQAAADEAAVREREAFGLQGQALYAQKNYGEAVTAFESALEATTRERAPKAWGDLQRRMAKALDSWADVSEGRAIAERRDRAIASFRAALEVLTPQESPSEWGFAQNHLGNALSSKAVESVDAEPLLAEAATAFEAALTVRTRATSPQDWAATQNNLANLARSRGLAALQPARGRFFAEAVRRFREALEVRDPKAEPAAWSGLQNNLGIVLGDQADEAMGAERARLRRESVEAFQRAGGAVERQAYPEEWANAQANLGIALSSQARDANEREAPKLRAAAIAAYRAALDVYTRATHPQDWARVQGDLADATEDEADEAPVEERRARRAEIAAMHRASLQVETRETLPVGWANRQHALAVVLRNAARDAEGEERLGLLREAETAARAVLTLYARDRAPQEWAEARRRLADILARQGYELIGEARAKVRIEAVTLRRDVLEVLSRGARSLGWAEAQLDLADALDDRASDLVDPERMALRQEAVAACRAALDVFTRDGTPQEWARAQSLLAYILNALREDSADAGHAELQAQVLAARRAVLEVYTREEFPEAWASGQLALSNALWVQARYYTTGAERLTLFAEAAEAARSTFAVYRVEIDPDGWAAAQARLAAALNALAAESGSEDERLKFRRTEIDARRAQLTVHTRAGQPLRWAGAQLSLANSLSALAAMLDDAEGAAAAEEAFEGYRAVMEVYSREEMPQDWAAAQADYAMALMRRGWAMDDKTRRVEFFSRAIEARRRVLEVTTRDGQPLAWATQAGLLAMHLIDRGKELEGEAAVQAMGEGIALHRSTLEFWRDGYPYQWAEDHRTLASALAAQAEHSAGEQKIRLLAEAVEALRTGLTQAHTGGDGLVLGLRRDLADTLQTLADEATGAERTRLLKETIEAYRAAIEAGDRVLPLETGGRNAALGWGLYRARLAGALNDYAAEVSGAERSASYKEAIERAREGLQVKEASAINAALNELQLARALVREADGFQGEERSTRLKEAGERARAARKEITPELSKELAAVADRIVAEAREGEG